MAEKEREEGKGGQRKQESRREREEGHRKKEEGRQSGGEREQEREEEKEGEEVCLFQSRSLPSQLIEGDNISQQA